MRKQTGVSLSGMIFVLFVLFFVALLGFKVGPPYMEFFTIQKNFKAMAANPELKTAPRKEIVNAYERYRIIDNTTAIAGEDIEINKDGANLVISASYSVKVPLVANVSLLLDFAPTSAAK
jgi:Domain of unknown function (DUF4845)